MLVDLRGGCGDKEGRVLLVGENMLLCKARSPQLSFLGEVSWTHSPRRPKRAWTPFDPLSLLHHPHA